LKRSRSQITSNLYVKNWKSSYDVNDVMLFMCVTWLTRQVLIVQQELPTFPGNISSLHDLSGTYELWLLLWYPQKFFFLTFSIVTMDSGRIPADFIYQLRIIAMQLVQEEGLVNLLLCYQVTSIVTLIDVLLWCHFTSGVALVDLLM
jgi:hypothetical protein